jgi:hypothetical protein
MSSETESSTSLAREDQQYINILGPKSLALGKKQIAKKNSYFEFDETDSETSSGRCEDMDAPGKEPSWNALKARRPFQPPTRMYKCHWINE